MRLILVSSFLADLIQYKIIFLEESEILFYFSNAFLFFFKANCKSLGVIISSISSRVFQLPFSLAVSIISKPGFIIIPSFINFSILALFILLQLLLGFLFAKY